MQHVVTQERIAHHMLNVPSTQSPSPFNAYVNQALLGMGTIVQVRDYTIDRPNGQGNNHKTLGPGLNWPRSMTSWSIEENGKIGLPLCADSCTTVRPGRYSLEPPFSASCSRFTLLLLVKNFLLPVKILKSKLVINLLADFLLVEGLRKIFCWYKTH